MPVARVALLEIQGVTFGVAILAALWPRRVKGARLGAVCSCCCCSTNCCKITSRPALRTVANVNDICSWTGREVLSPHSRLSPPRRRRRLRVAKDSPRLMVKSPRPA